MRCNIIFMPLLTLLLTSSFASAQQSWEWDWLKQEWEYETDGTEYEYDPYTGEFEVERDRALLPDRNIARYYWSPPYGTQPPGVRSGRIPSPPITRPGTAYDGYWPYGYYRPYTYHWPDNDYGIDDYDRPGDLTYDYDDDYDTATIQYDFDEQLSGEVLGLDQIRGAYGEPDSVQLRVRSEDGQIRTVELGDVTYARRYLPTLRQGDQVVIGGRFEEVDGRQVFNAREIRASDRRYLIPEYLYDRRIEGRLVGLRKVALEDGDVQNLVARVRTQQGETIEVLLGSSDDLQRTEQTLRPGDRVRLQGYQRSVGEDRSFVVQDVTIRRQGNNEARRNAQRAADRRRQQDQTSEQRGE